MSLQAQLSNFNRTRQFLHTLSHKQLQQLRAAMLDGTLTLTQVESAYDAVRDDYEWRLLKNK